jgi:hypothetical protein
MKLFTTLPLTYLGSINYFWNCLQSDVIVFTDQLQFTKRSASTLSPFFSKNEIQLRIPVKRGNHKQPISEKMIEVNEPWKTNHIKTLKHLFHNEPYAYYYLPQLEALYSAGAAKLSDFLFRLNAQIMQWLYSKASLRMASTFPKETNSNRFILTVCSELDTSNYINEHKVFDNQWLDKRFLELNQVNIHYFSPMRQASVFTPFNHQPILAWLMRYGPEAGYLLKQFLPERV